MNMKVGYVQTSPIFGEITQNFEQVENLLGNTKADLIVLPELFATGYTFISKEETESSSQQDTHLYLRKKQNLWLKKLKEKLPNF